MQIVRGRAAADIPTLEPTGTFTGQVWGDPVLPATKEGIAGNVVTFTPGARTHWHVHPGGQLLVVTSGLGLVGDADGRVHQVRAGDLIWTPPGERHWHGGTARTVLSHLAISNGVTEWHAAVTDEEYGIEPS